MRGFILFVINVDVMVMVTRLVHRPPPTAATGTATTTTATTDTAKQQPSVESNSTHSPSSNNQGESVNQIAAKSGHWMIAEWRHRRPARVSRQNQVEDQLRPTIKNRPLNTQPPPKKIRGKRFTFQFFQLLLVSTKVRGLKFSEKLPIKICLQPL